MRAKDMTLRQKLGQKLSVGFHGTDITPELMELIREYKVGNVILFLRNVESAAQLRRLCGRLREVILAETGVIPFIIIDQEGGMVSRVPEDAVNVPGAMALAAAGDEDTARTAAEITIRQLRGLGPNFNMAPVMDVNSNAANPVIGVRSFGDEAERVSRLTLAQVRAYGDSGVLCCGKHFPGHGDTAVDSHLGLPRIDKTEEELMDCELLPFRRAIAAGIPAIMTTHILFPKLTAEPVPATMSREIITGLLRQKLGFDGLVLTDCLEMDAIKKFYGTPRGVVASIRAGADIAGISSTFALERESAAALLAAAEAGELDMAELEESVDRILRWKETVDRPMENTWGQAGDFMASYRMARQALTLYDGTVPTPDAHTLFCGCADYRVTQAANESGGRIPFPEYLSRAFGGRCLVTPKDPTDGDIAAAVQAAEGCDTIVLGTCNAHLFRGQLRLAEALSRTGKPLTAVALRNPYDLPLLPECRCRLAAFDYSADSLRALAEVFRGGALTGRFPVKL